MKSIQEYISEAFITKNNIKNIGVISEVSEPISKYANSKLDFYWPKNEECTEWKMIELKKPNKFVVYYDKYHKCKHIASFGDMLQSYIFTGSYEDFTPDVLIKGFKTLKEAVEYAVDDGIELYYDSEKFINNVINGNIKESDYEDSTELKMFMTPTKEAIRNTMSYLY